MQLKRCMNALMQKQDLDQAIFPQLLEDMLDTKCNEFQISFAGIAK